MVDNLNNHPVIYRSPYSISDDAVVEEGYASELIELTNKTEHPFEVSHVAFKLTALAQSAIADPQPTVLDRLITVTGGRFDRDEDFGDNLVLHSADGAGLFYWTAQPTVLAQGDSIAFRVHGKKSFVIAHEGRQKRVDEIHVEITLEGELLSIELEGSASQNDFVEDPDLSKSNGAHV
jgi:hypothetical protein